MRKEYWRNDHSAWGAWLPPPHLCSLWLSEFYGERLRSLSKIVTEPLRQAEFLLLIFLRHPLCILEYIVMLKGLPKEELERKERTDVKEPRRLSLSSLLGRQVTALSGHPQASTPQDLSRGRGVNRWGAEASSCFVQVLQVLPSVSQSAPFL